MSREDALEEEKAIHSSILAWKNPMDRGALQGTVHGVARVGDDLATKPPQRERTWPFKTGVQEAQ